jgi:hypothetical protein
MGAVNTTYTFTANDTITSTKMNNIIDQTTITGEAVFDSTLAVISGKLKVNAQGITSTEIAQNAVTATQLANGTVAPIKLSTGYPSWTTTGNFTVNGSSTALSSVSAGTASVSIGSARTASGTSNIDFNSTFPLTTYEARISRESGANGNLVISNTGTGSLVLGTAPIPTPSGTAPVYGARAWVSFDATRNAAGGSDIANTDRYIRNSKNVTKVTKTATGLYDVYITTALPDADYTVSGSCNETGINAAGASNNGLNGFASTATLAKVSTVTFSSNALNCVFNSVIIFG